MDVAENTATYDTAVVDKIVVDKDVIKVLKGFTIHIIQKSNILSYTMPRNSKLDNPGPNACNFKEVEMLLCNLKHLFYSLSELQAMCDKIIIDEDEIIAYTMQPTSANPSKYDKFDIIIYPKSNIIEYLVPTDIAMW